MNATTLRKGLILAIVSLSSVAFCARGAPDPRRAIRVSPATLALLATNRVRPPVTAAITNQMLKVKIPTNSTLLVRRGGNFVSAAPVRREGTNQVYELRPTDVYVARGAPPPPTPLSTNAVPLPDAVRAMVNGQEIEGHIEVALQSEQMVYNSATRGYEGTLDICFRSSAPVALARKLLPLDLRLHSTPGLQLATNALTLTNVGNAGCRGIDLQCSAPRSGAKVTVKSDAAGDQDFTIEFERAPFLERFKTPLIILGGVVLGGLGGLVRTWHPPRVKQPWKRMAEGGFCGLLLVLLGQVGVRHLFQIEGPVTTSVLLGLCGVLGYLGVRTFEHFAPKETDRAGKAQDDKKSDG